MKVHEEILPFPLALHAGSPVTDQIVYAVKKAVTSGLLKPGSKFPSIRLLSQELRIHSNTAHKAIARLVNEGLLEVHPGRGTVVAWVAEAASEKEIKYLENEVERLVVEVKNRKLTLNDLQEMVENQWKRLQGI